VRDLTPLLKDEEKAKTEVLAKLNKELESTLKECTAISDTYIELLTEDQLDITTEISWVKTVQQTYSRVTLKSNEELQRIKN